MKMSYWCQRPDGGAGGKGGSGGTDGAVDRATDGSQYQIGITDGSPDQNTPDVSSGEGGSGGIGGSGGARAKATDGSQDQIGDGSRDQNTPDVSSCNVSFPESGFYGPNILVSSNDALISANGMYDPMTNYELVVQHDATALVTVVMTRLSGRSIWYIDNPLGEWHATNFNGNPDASDGGSQTFQAPNVAGEFEESIYFTGVGQARFDVFECGAPTPTFSKTISWSPTDGSVA